MAGQYDYRDRQALQELAVALRNITDADEAKVAAFLLDNRLMVTNLLFAIVAWIVRLRWKTSLPLWIVMAKSDKHKAEARRLINAAMLWIMNGKDSTTKDAAGGYNQTEIDKLVFLLRQIGALPKAV